MEYQSQCTCFFTYGQCLGRRFGKSLLSSKAVRPHHPLYSDPIASKHLKLFFDTMDLSPRAIEKLYDVFQKIDTDRSGSLDLNEFLTYFVLQKSRFAKRAFSVLDADGSGDINFVEFVLGMFNFCTFDTVSLARFAFTIYDEDASGFLDSDEIESICKDLYGKRNYKHNKSAQKCIAQLKSGDWMSAEDNTHQSVNDTELDFVAFEKFCRHHEIMLLFKLSTYCSTTMLL